MITLAIGTKNISVTVSQCTAGRKRPSYTKHMTTASGTWFHQNIELVTRFMDAKAKIASFGEDFHVVSTKFLRRDNRRSWYGPINTNNLAKILLKLKALHNNGFIHGDLRVCNMILHTGISTDFNFFWCQGSRYPSTFLEISGSGI